MRVVVVLVFMATLAAGQGWTNTLGGPEKHGQTDLPDGSWDILDGFTLHGPCDEQSPVVTQSTDFAYGEHGFVRVMVPTVDGDCTQMAAVGCNLWVVKDHARPEDAYKVNLDQCGGGFILATYEKNGKTYVVVSIHSEALPSGLIFYDIAAGGKVVYKISPDEMGFLSNRPNDAQYNRPAMACWEGAISEEDVLYTACYQTTTGFEAYGARVMAIDLKTDAPQILWHKAIPTGTELALPGGSPFTNLNEYPQPVASLAPLGVALAEDGIFVAFYTSCVEYRCNYQQLNPTLNGTESDTNAAYRNIYGMMAWTDYEGNLVGSYNPTDPTAPNPTSTRANLFSRGTLVLGNQGFMALGPHLIRASVTAPQADDPVPMPGLNPYGGYLSVPAPVTDGKTVYVSSFTSVTAYNGISLELAWNQVLLGGETGWKPTTLVDPDDGILAVAFHEGIDGLSDANVGNTWMTGGTMFKVDANTGTILQALPLNLTDMLRLHPYPDALPDDEALPLGIGIKPLPLADGKIILGTGEGRFLVMGAAQPRGEALKTSNLYPALREDVTVGWENLGAKNVHIAWGDGNWEEHPGDTTTDSHRYAVQGTYSVAVTAAFADDTTSTRSITLFVGQSPPVKLTVIQQAFSPENAEMTWGLIGLAVVIFGWTVSRLSRRHHRGRVGRYMKDIDEVRRRGDADAIGSLAEARHLHVLFGQDLLSGKLDEDKHRLLTSRTLALMQKLARRILTADLANATPAFRDLVWAVLHDDEVTAGEYQALLDATGRERKLSAGARDRVMQVVQAWNG